MKNIFIILGISLLLANCSKVDNETVKAERLLLSETKSGTLMSPDWYYLDDTEKEKSKKKWDDGKKLRDMEEYERQRREYIDRVQSELGGGGEKGGRGELLNLKDIVVSCAIKEDTLDIQYVLDLDYCLNDNGVLRLWVKSIKSHNFVFYKPNSLDRLVINGNDYTKGYGYSSDSTAFIALVKGTFFIEYGHCDPTGTLADPNPGGLLGGGLSIGGLGLGGNNSNLSNNGLPSIPPLPTVVYFPKQYTFETALYLCEEDIIEYLYKQHYPLL